MGSRVVVAVLGVVRGGDNFALRIGHNRAERVVAFFGRASSIANATNMYFVFASTVNVLPPGVLSRITQVSRVYQNMSAYFVMLKNVDKPK